MGFRFQIHMFGNFPFTTPTTTAHTCILGDSLLHRHYSNRKHFWCKSDALSIEPTCSGLSLRVPPSLAQCPSIFQSTSVWREEKKLFVEFLLLTSCLCCVCCMHYCQVCILYALRCCAFAYSAYNRYRAGKTGGCIAYLLTSLIFRQGSWPLGHVTTCICSIEHRLYWHKKF